MFLEREEGRETNKHQFVFPLIYALIDCFLYVSWPGIELTTLVYKNNALSNWAIWPGPYLSSLNEYVVRIKKCHGCFEVINVQAELGKKIKTQFFLILLLMRNYIYMSVCVFIYVGLRYFFPSSSAPSIHI